MPPNQYLRTCLAGLTITLVAAGCDRSGNEFVAPPPPTVTVSAPVREEVTTYSEFTGRTAAMDTIEIRARVKGFLQEIHFEPGRKVEKGAPLFTIEQAPFIAAVEGATAELEGREAARDLAETTLERARKAFENGALSDLEMREREAQLKSAQAAMNMAKAALDTAKLDLSYTEITAPATGRVSRDLVNLGNLVGDKDATLLTTIVVDQPIHAYFNANERDLLAYLDKRRPSDQAAPQRSKVRLQLSDGATYEHVGEIDFAENRIDTQTGTLELRAVFPNPDGKLYPGLFCRILRESKTEDSLLVPEFALQRDLAGAFLLVVDENDTVQRRDVKRGTLRDGMRVITEGLEGTERVIVNGLQRARPGIQVTTMEAEAQAASPAGDADNAGEAEGG